MYKLLKNDIEINISLNPLEIRSLKVKEQEICYQQDGLWSKNWPFLFPIVGAVKNNSYSYNGQEYSLPRHGFFRDIKSWKIEEEMDGLVTFSMESNGEFKNIYPFEFAIKHQIEIIENKVILTYEIFNKDEKEMIFSMGHHPAFLVEPDGVLEFDEEEQFSSESVPGGLMVREPNKLTTIKAIKIKDIDFSDQKFWATTNLKSDFVTYKDSKINYQVDLSDYQIMLLWSTGKDNFICLEPWLGTADFGDREDNKLENKEFTIKLPENESYICEFKMTFN